MRIGIRPQAALLGPEVDKGRDIAGLDCLRRQGSISGAAGVVDGGKKVTELPFLVHLPVPIPLAFFFRTRILLQEKKDFLLMDKVLVRE